MTDKLYPCSRCDGEGRVKSFSHVLGGVCFKCGGSGKQKTKPRESVKWAVFGHCRKTGRAGIVYNVGAPNHDAAVKKARAKYERANAAWRDAWDMGKAFARTIDELIAEGAFETA